MLRKNIIIINKLGLHARASAKLVNRASRFASELEISKGNHTVNGKSIMGVMMLAASQGTTVELAVDGEDEVAMLEDITTLINNRFGEEE